MSLFPAVTIDFQYIHPTLNNGAIDVVDSTRRIVVEYRLSFCIQRSIFKQRPTLDLKIDSRAAINIIIIINGPGINSPAAINIDGPGINININMDEFGPMDDDWAPVDEEEVTSLLADDGYKTITKRIKPKTQPKPQPHPKPQPQPLFKPQPTVPPQSSPSPAPKSSLTVPPTNPRDPRPQAKAQTQSTSNQHTSKNLKTNPTLSC